MTSTPHRQDGIMFTTLSRERGKKIKKVLMKEDLIMLVVLIIRTFSSSLSPPSQSRAFESCQDVGRWAMPAVRVGIIGIMTALHQHESVLLFVKVINAQ